VSERAKNVEYTQPDEFFLWLLQFEMETILQITTISYCYFADDSADIYGDALALDGIGLVFELDLHFSITRQEAEKIESFVGSGSIVNAKGCFSFIPGADGGITLHNPKLSPLDPEVSLSYMNDIFVKNRWKVKD